jgi:hypothetical protein
MPKLDRMNKFQLDTSLTEKKAINNKKKAAHKDGFQDTSGPIS